MGPTIDACTVEKMSLQLFILRVTLWYLIVDACTVRGLKAYLPDLQRRGATLYSLFPFWPNQLPSSPAHPNPIRANPPAHRKATKEEKNRKSKSPCLRHRTADLSRIAPHRIRLARGRPTPPPGPQHRNPIPLSSPHRRVRELECGHGSAPAGDRAAGRGRRRRRRRPRPGEEAAPGRRVPVAEDGQRLHGRAAPRGARRRRVRPPRQRPRLLRPLQPQAPHARRPLPRRQGRVSTPSLAAPNDFASLLSDFASCAGLTHARARAQVGGGGGGRARGGAHRRAPRLQRHVALHQPRHRQVPREHRGRVRRLPERAHLLRRDHLRAACPRRQTRPALPGHLSPGRVQL